MQASGRTGPRARADRVQDHLKTRHALAFEAGARSRGRSRSARCAVTAGCSPGERICRALQPCTTHGQGSSNSGPGADDLPRNRAEGNSCLSLNP